MSTMPQNPSLSTKRRNPSLYPPEMGQDCPRTSENEASHTITPHKKRLNKLETRYRDILLRRGENPLEQAITLALDPPFKSYRPDLAYVSAVYGLVFIETKGPHRFREKGIAKAALAAKTYPMFRFELVEYDKDNGWKTTLLSP